MPDADALTPDGGGLWLSISALADRKGIKKQSVSERVAKLRGLGKLDTKPGPGRSILVNVVQYDLAVGEVGDGVKEQAADTARVLRIAPDLEAEGDEPELPLPPADPSLRRAQADRARYDAELKKIELLERRGHILPLVRVLEAVDATSQDMLRSFERIELRAAELAAAVAKDGEAGARAFLRGLKVDLRKELAEALRGLAQAGKAEESKGPIDVEVPEES